MGRGKKSRARKTANLSAHLTSGTRNRQDMVQKSTMETIPDGNMETAPNDEKTTFFSLSLELRWMIYDFCLPDEDVPEECYPDWSLYKRCPHENDLPPMLVPVKRPIVMDLCGEARDRCHERMRFTQCTTRKWPFKQITYPCRPFRPDIDTLCVSNDDHEGFRAWAEYMHKCFIWESDFIVSEDWELEDTDNDSVVELKDLCTGDDAVINNVITRRPGVFKKTGDVHKGCYYKPWEIKKMRIAAADSLYDWDRQGRIVMYDMDIADEIGEILFCLRGDSSSGRHVEILDLGSNIFRQGRPKLGRPMQGQPPWTAAKTSWKKWLDKDVSECAADLADDISCHVYNTALDSAGATDWIPWATEFEGWAEDSMHVETRPGGCLHEDEEEHEACMGRSPHYAKAKTVGQWKRRKGQFGLFSIKRKTPQICKECNFKN